LTNDERIPFYAGLFRDDYRVINISRIKHWAKKNIRKRKNRSLIVLRSSEKNRIVEEAPVAGFQMVKKFGTADEVIRIYSRVE
jgi:hypothetical protein